MPRVVVEVLAYSEWTEDRAGYEAFLDALSQANIATTVEQPLPPNPGQVRAANADVAIYLADAAANGSVGYIVAKAIEILGRRARARFERDRQTGVRRAGVVYAPDGTIMHSFDLANGEVLGPTIYGPRGEQLTVEPPSRDDRS